MVQLNYSKSIFQWIDIQNGLTSLSTGNINQADAIAEVPQRLSNSSAYGSTETTGSSGGASPQSQTTTQDNTVVLDVRGLTR